MFCCLNNIPQRVCLLSLQYKDTFNKIVLYTWYLCCRVQVDYSIRVPDIGISSGESASLIIITE